MKFTDTLFTQDFRVSGVPKAQLSMVAHTSTQGTEAEESSQLSGQSGLQSNTLYEEEKKTLQRTSNEQLHSNSFQLPSKKPKIHFLTSPLELTAHLQPLPAPRVGASPTVLD